jgi:HK97 gp10 family phage protein
MAVKVKVEGLKELDAALGELTKATAKNVLKRVLKRAAQPIADAARGKVPVDTGKLRDSIIVGSNLSEVEAAGNAAYAAKMRAGGSKAEAGAALRAAARAAKAAGGDASFAEMFVGPDNRPNAHLVEFGTGERFHRSGKSVGSVAPQPYMRPAWDGEKGRALEIIKADLGDEIMKAATRAAKRAASRAAKG